MKLIFTGVVVALLAAGPLASIGHAQAGSATTTTPQDKTLETRLEKRIHGDATLKKYDIDVDVHNGVATLTGTVATEAERTKAATLANVPGITRVDNKIVTDLDAGTRGVKGTAGKVGEKTKEGAEKVGEKTKEGASKVGEKSKDVGGKVVDKTKEGVSKTGEVITDGWITTRIKSKYIGDEALRASDISVDTNDHVVTLSGTVVSEAARTKAVADAKEVEGVHRVVDKLRVVPKR